ncbi:MAG: energy-coupling factor ABC transporter ATP-binding protein [Planctomycetota bacterium]
MAKTVVDLQSVTFSYPDPREVLRELSLALADGETLGLVGPIGAGKTTLFLLLAGLLRPHSGSVQVLGREAGDVALRGRVGVVFQRVEEQLFSTSVSDDVAFGPLNLGVPMEEVPERVRRALHAVGLEGFEERVPHHLSGGEKRKVALAAVLSMQPELYLLDEPSSDLDSRARAELISLLKKLPESKIIATHDFELLCEVADRVVVLGDGSIRASGAPLELLADVARMRSCGLEVPAGLRALYQLKQGGVDLMGRERTNRGLSH